MADYRYVDDVMSATASTAPIDRQDPSYTIAFGHGREPRAGEAEFPFGGFYEAGNPFLRRAREWYTKNYYSTPEGTKEGVRRVYFSFDKPVHGVLKRLLDAHKELGASLADAYVVSIPLGDIIAHPPEGIERNSKASIMNAFNTFDAMLDFSALA